MSRDAPIMLLGIIGRKKQRAKANITGAKYVNYIYNSYVLLKNIHRISRVPLIIGSLLQKHF